MGWLRFVGRAHFISNDLCGACIDDGVSFSSDVRRTSGPPASHGEDHHAVDLPGWVNHDLRRVVRSGLSALRVPHNVAEVVLAHRPPGIVGTYNLHEYEDEKAEALEAWAQRLATIVSPPAKVPDKKIVPLRERRR